MEELIVLKNISKHYSSGNIIQDVLYNVNIEIEKKEFVVMVGPSGAGKTTLLNILGGLDTCNTGEIWIDGDNISNFRNKQLTAYRRNKVGFVFQFYNLIQNLTVKENVELAAQICKNPLNAEETLKAVGLKEKYANFPAQLSGGEQQRTAIARALAKNPKLMLCDEPTGALDYNTGKQILKLLHTFCKEKEMTVIVITHNQAITPMADRVIKIKNGQIKEMIMNNHPDSIDELEW